MGACLHCGGSRCKHRTCGVPRPGSGLPTLCLPQPLLQAQMLRTRPRLAVRMGAAVASGIAGPRTQALLRGHLCVIRTMVEVGAVRRVLLLLRPVIAVEGAAGLLPVLAVRPVGAVVRILLVAGACKRILYVEAAHPAGASGTTAASAHHSVCWQGLPTDKQTRHLSAPFHCLQTTALTIHPHP